MEETPHLVAHFMAAGAEKRLEDYHFLRSTYETISSQENQLNRILRMLGEDEINLTWRNDILPIGRARTRFPYEFDRTGNTLVLQGSIAYERLRDLDPDSSRHSRQMTPSPSFRRSQEFRERRQNWSEQRDLGNCSSTTPSASRLKALAEFEEAMAESEVKRRQQTEENRSNLVKTKADSSEGVERTRRQIIDDNDKTSKKQDNAENQSNETIESTSINLFEKTKEENETNNLNASNDLPDEHKKQEKSTVEFGRFSVFCKSVPTSVRLKNNQDKLVRLSCQWSPTNSSSPVEFYTIEREIDNGQWINLGQNIKPNENQVQIDLNLLTEDEQNGKASSHFRLTAHLKSGESVSSQPTEEISLKFVDEPSVIVPDVEILSENSVQLSWNNEQIQNENKSEGNQKEIYDVEKKENENDWQKLEKVSLSKESIQIDNLEDPNQSQFRLIPSESTTNEPNIDEPETFTVHDVNQWLNCLNVAPSSPTTVDVNISDEAFQQFSSYQVEFCRSDQTDQWKKVSDITKDCSHLTIDKLKQETDYKFRFTPVSNLNENNLSQFSVVLDVKMPPKRKGRFDKTEEKVQTKPTTFNIEKVDEHTVIIGAVLDKDQPTVFDDVYEIFSKNQQQGDQWNKIGSIDKDHLTATIDNLEENSNYSFKVENVTRPSDPAGSSTVQQFQIETKSQAPKFNPSIFLEKIEASLEDVVNGVMKAAAGHKVVEEPVNVSLNEVIREVFRDEKLVPNEQFGFDALSLSNDLQLYRGPKQMMLNELEGEETVDVSKHYGEIIIHNYRHAQQTPGSVVVKEENGNTRVSNIDGDVIIRNVVSDVLLSNEQTRHQLSMNIVGQAFLKGVQGTLIASKFKGIILVKSVNMP